MSQRPDDLIGLLESYTQSTRQQLGTDHEQEHYWRGVLFLLELALLEARRRQVQSDPPTRLPDELAEALSQMVFDQLENLIALCQARIKRELLVYNAKVTRHELLKGIRRMTGAPYRSNYELRADPDVEPPGSEG